MRVVLDSSIALSWYFEDERTEASRAVLDQVTSEGALVPALWKFEVANGLQMAVRRRRVDSAFRDRALANLSAIRTEIDSGSNEYVWSASLLLADRHALTVYDAVYLELAQRRRMELATLDKALIRAGRAEFVPTIGTSDV